MASYASYASNAFSFRFFTSRCLNVFEREGGRKERERRIERAREREREKGERKRERVYEKIYENVLKLLYVVYVLLYRMEMCFLADKGAVLMGFIG